MDKTLKFEFLEHTADVYIAAHGKTMKEAFENAALAMFEVMTDTDKVSPDVEDSVEIEAEDDFALLYSWLEALLVKFETKNMLYSNFKISSIDETSDGFRIKATLWGEKFDPEKHTQKVGVKAVTYHRMEIIKEIDKVTLEFILDI
ncbi:MAG: archease [Candidatus Bathyarchaeia archaeon]|jgi:SHS2 domain-containing protein|nr:archease [Candidatus Bathyarchaeia archaeon]